MYSKAYIFAQEVRSKILGFKRQGRQGYAGCSEINHNSLQPLPRLHRCKRPSSSKRNASVQSFLLAGDFLYNQ